MSLLDLSLEIQAHLEVIERVVGRNYKLTLIARYIGTKPLDADICVTLDDLELVKGAIDRLKDKTPVIAPEARP